MSLTAAPIPRRAEPAGFPTPRPWNSLIASVLIAVGGVAAVWPILVGLGAPMFNRVAVLAHLAGMLAGSTALVQILLMSRWPLLEREVGADRLTRWHSRLGPTVLVLVVIHAAAAVEAWSDARRLALPAALLEVLQMPYLVAATVATILMILIAAVSVGIARRQLRFETWHGIHLLGYVAVAFAFMHAIAGPDLAGHRILQVGWALGYVQTFLFVVRYRLLAPLQAATRHRLRVSQLIREAPGIVSIVLEGRDLHELGAIAGQFFRWRFLTPTPGTPHTPSPCPPPPRAIGSGSPSNRSATAADCSKTSKSVPGSSPKGHTAP